MSTRNRRGGKSVVERTSGRKINLQENDNNRPTTPDEMEKDESLHDRSLVTSTPIIPKPTVSIAAPKASTSRDIPSFLAPTNLFNTTMNKTVKDNAVGESNHSHRSSSSSLRRQRLLEMEIAAEKRKLVLDEEEARLKLGILAAKRAREDTISKKLRELAACEGSDNDESLLRDEIENSKSDLRQWMEGNIQPNQLPPPQLKINEAVKYKCNKNHEKKKENCMANFLARQTVGCKLPSFSGNPQDWPMFISQYESTTRLCGLGPHENMVRLQEALKGKARETVESILGFPENVDMVIESLRMSFGRDDLIIKTLMAKAKLAPQPREGKPESIIAFYNTVNIMVTTMQRMKCAGHLNNPCLLEEFVQKLSPQLKSHWALYVLDHNSESSLQSFVVWLKRWASAQCLLPANEPVSNDKNGKKSTAAVMNTVEDESLDTEKEMKAPKKAEFNCLYCKKPKHQINRCRKFKVASVDDRWSFVKENKCCFICLRQGHNTTNCKSGTKCSTEGCERKHHGLLHNPAPATTAVVSDEAVVMNAVAGNQALLKILPVTLKSDKGEVQTYALLDEGSTVTLIEEDLANELKLEGAVVDFTFRGVNAITTHTKSKIVELMLMPSGSNTCYPLKNVRTVKNLRLPTQSVRLGKKRWPYLNDLDIPMYQSATPKLLIGQDHVDLIVTREVRQGPPNAPVASLTKLGWVLHGSNYYCLHKTDVVLNCIEKDGDNSLHELVKSYFKLESLEISNRHEVAKSREDKLALEIMEKTTQRVGDRWMTGLLWRNKEVIFPESRRQAERRLQHIEKRMDRDPVFAEAYCKKIDDHISKGYIRELSPEEAEVRTGKTWYLPHFAVVNPNKPGKIRVVWDAAAKSNGVSLNTKLLTGPDLYNPLPGVVIKFRQRAVGASGDVEEFFPQVKVLPEDCQAQRFLWRGKDRKQKPKEYEHVRLTFGSASSPAQAQYVKNRNAEELLTEFPRAVDAITNRHYMDDYLDSFDSVEEAKRHIKDVIHVHATGGFRIRNWISSHPAVLQSMDQNLVADGMKILDEEIKYPVERVLGLRWNPNTDTFSFAVKFHKVPFEVLSMERRPTKRELLKVIMSIFDPLGFISQFHVKGKILLQEIWKSGIGWDDELSAEQFAHWSLWMTEMKTLQALEIPRFYGFPPDVQLQLHVFCDASAHAYAAVAYLRCLLPSGVQVSLVMSKTRVAPLKPMSIPRLELLAALTGSKMADFVRHHHDLTIGVTIMWTDSQTVLRWIRSDANRYKTFVAQRLGEIDELTDVSQWRWVPSKDNVADDATRSETELQFEIESRWYQGPAFLRSDEKDWPKEVEQRAKLKTDGLEEVLEFVNVVAAPTFCLPDVARFSSYSKLIRSTAWMMRFVARCKGEKCSHKQLQPAEIVAAEKMWWRFVQWESYPTEMDALVKGKQLSPSSSLKVLCPFIDDEGIMRSHSRAKHMLVSDEKVILHRSHPFTKLLVIYFHRLHMHIGQETVANEVRQKYWIPALRQLVKSVQHNCTVCKRLNVKPFQPIMGLLPEERLTPYVKPFHFTGMDYFGPLSVRVGKRYEKRYGVIFSCLTTRAIHLEVAEKLTTDSAIMAIRRLVGLRGPMDTIWSDNGKNLVGANNELKLMLRKMDADTMNKNLALEPATKGITWKFIPPASPNMGGSWERLIRSVKRAMMAVLSKQILRPEALQTLFVEISHTLNSRPLTHVSVDPKDPESITPNDLLCGMKTKVVQPIDSTKINLRKQWVASQMFADNFWRRWIKEYRPQIVQRTKWYKSGQNLKIDDVVILVDEGFPRNYWPMGRVTDVHPGRDGVVRVVDVKTSTGTYRRPVSKMCLLDIKEK